MKAGQPITSEDVRETNYLDADFGPEEDTESYYKRTPAGAERMVFQAPAVRKQAVDENRIPRKKSSADGHSDADAASTRMRLAILGGIGLVGFAAIGVFVVAAMLLVSSPTELQVAETPPAPPAPETTKPKEEGKWEGLRVKKGLR